LSRFKQLFLPEDIEARSRLYVVILWAVALCVAAALVTQGRPLGNPYVVMLLAAVAVIAERGRVHLGSNLSESISLVPTLFAAVLFGPVAAMVVAVASFASEFRRPYLKWASYTASRSITAAATGLVALAV